MHTAHLNAHTVTAEQVAKLKKIKAHFLAYAKESLGATTLKQHVIETSVLDQLNNDAIQYYPPFRKLLRTSWTASWP